MANTVKLKMRCIELTPSAGGGPERVIMEEVYSPTAAEHTTAVINEAPKPKGRADFSIGSAAGKGQFIKGQAYSLAFTEVAG